VAIDAKVEAPLGAHSDTDDDDDDDDVRWIEILYNYNYCNAIH